MKRINIEINKTTPKVMHIDLNSCFAIIEQQANRLLRGRPVGVAAYDTPRGFVLAASYEAKAKGVKLGVNVRESRQLCPDIIIVTPDPAKYREAHKIFKRLLLEFTDDVTPKSIDEFVLDLTNSPSLQKNILKHKNPLSKIRPWKGGDAVSLAMENIGQDIKRRIREELGEWVTVNVGIGPNRFLAKYAAGFNKPDGMTTINHTNLRAKYTGMDLTDLPGINVRYRRRLRMYGINTPLEFLEADRDTLQKVVFRSIVGHYWYLRLRGYEIDDKPTNMGSIGHQYALPKQTWDKAELARLLVKLCEKVGRRLRKQELTAGGIHLYLDFVREKPDLVRDNGFIGGDSIQAGKSWHKGNKVGYRLYSTNGIYTAANKLLQEAIINNKVRGMSITVYELAPALPEQLNLLEEVRGFRADKHVSDAVDEINDRYGEFVITPASMMDMSGEILDRIAFGSIRDM